MCSKGGAVEEIVRVLQDGPAVAESPEARGRGLGFRRKIVRDFVWSHINFQAGSQSGRWNGDEQLL